MGWLFDVGGRGTRWVVRVALAIAALGACAVAAGAKECGDGVACACGDSVRGAAVLEADLTDCAAGLRVKQGTLDCAGRGIFGAGDGEGVVVEATGATVRRCLVSGFRTGIRLRGGGSNLLAGNDVVDNARYGIELAVATSGNLLVGNIVLDSGDEGIHVGTGADGNAIVFNLIEGSGKENLYFLDVTGVWVEANLIRGGGSAGMYVKHTTDSRFRGNRVFDRPIQLRGGSDANLFEGNRLEGAGFLFQAYEDDERGWEGPEDNEVRGGSVRGVKTCFRFEGATHNLVHGVMIDGCKPSSQAKRGGIAPVANVVEVEAGS